MFAVTPNRSVFHFDGPVGGFVDIVGGLAEARHRLDADGVTFDEFVAAAFFTIIRDFGGFVHGFANAVANVVFNHAEVAFS